MPLHMRQPEHRLARPLGVLAIAVGISLLVIAGVSTRPSDEVSTIVERPVIETSDPTVLGEVIDRTTLPDAPPAEAAGVTTTESDASSPDPRTTPQTAGPSPTVAPTGSTIPVTSTTKPPTTTSTTAPTTTTTQSTTTTTELVTTTTETPPP